MEKLGGRSTPLMEPGTPEKNSHNMAVYEQKHHLRESEQTHVPYSQEDANKIQANQAYITSESMKVPSFFPTQIVPPQMSNPAGIQQQVTAYLSYLNSMAANSGDVNVANVAATTTKIAAAAIDQQLLKKEDPEVDLNEPEQNLDDESSSRGSDPQAKRNRPYKCQICDSAFADPYHLKRHLQTHSDSPVKPFECQFCQKAFSDSYRLRRHLNTHIETPPTPYKCQFCEKSFSDSYRLKRHLSSHADREGPPLKPHKCQYCDKSFSDYYKLKRHGSTHTGLKPYKCHLCDTRVSRQEHLKRHLLTHTESRPFKCSLCGFSGRRADIVQKHVSKNHYGQPVCVERVFRISEVEKHLNPDMKIINVNTEGIGKKKKKKKKKNDILLGATEAAGLVDRTMHNVDILAQHQMLERQQQHQQHQHQIDRHSVHGLERPPQTQSQPAPVMLDRTVTLERTLAQLEAASQAHLNANSNGTGPIINTPKRSAIQALVNAERGNLSPDHNLEVSSVSPTFATQSLVSQSQLPSISGMLPGTTLQSDQAIYLDTTHKSLINSMAHKLARNIPPKLLTKYEISSPQQSSPNKDHVALNMQIARSEGEPISTAALGLSQHETLYVQAPLRSSIASELDAVTSRSASLASDLQAPLRMSIASELQRSDGHSIDFPHQLSVPGSYSANMLTHYSAAPMRPLPVPNHLVQNQYFTSSANLGPVFPDASTPYQRLPVVTTSHSSMASQHASDLMNQQSEKDNR